ncbi:MAG: Tad domain-containing protein [Anaerolineae bacterium]|nr:Tad domain-containing protein [Anaerolineae bacterium]
MFQEDNERGQSAVIIAFAVMVLLALVALVVDIGNAYAHRRLVQNACDASALAGARKLADDRVHNKVTHKMVLREINEYAERNGLDPATVDAWFIDAVGERVSVVYDVNSRVPHDAQGVEVAGDLPFSTYFAHLLGFDTMQASTNAMVWVLKGLCSDAGLFPVVVSTSTFTETTGGAPIIGKVYTLWDHDDKNLPGNFGWLYWVDGEGVNHCPDDCPQGPQTTVLGPNIFNVSRSGEWTVTQEVHGAVGVNFQPVLDELEPYVTWEDPPREDEDIVYIPLYDSATGTGNTATYHITSFAAFRLVCAYSSQSHYIERETGDCAECNTGSSDDKCIRGEFLNAVTSVPGQDGCTDTGLSFVTFRRPKSAAP